VEGQKPAQPASPPAALTPEPKAQEPSRELRARPESRSAPARAPQSGMTPMEDARRERAADPVAQQRNQTVPGAPPSGDEANAAAAVAARRDAQTARQAEAPAPAQSRPALGALAKAQQSPQQWLDRIAELRQEGRHDEADRQLAEFRRAYPDYHLSDEMKAKVEKK
jgi:hypothetical protein